MLPKLKKKFLQCLNVNIYFLLGKFYFYVVNYKFNKKKLASIIFYYNLIISFCLY
jgi:hypothetical protein